ncbi:MAG: hypothetical protein A2857_00030 [Candidatus Levybacteria bacterium RIFCSPHIGHO2_01_FULL_36_15]|nr:MAG: hypothetical protein A2857_00030 [Candidatus Levybacteria bacterium RIFCSPHIGHO2_01_FULL_36_15]OGH36934.1 MAG: hypothetical protein A2905_00950 [Candidatus Levybacteria bacterium RIFCSPLOWO2_01_FULL_36_10]
MTYTVSITSQGQINIPAKIRQELGFSKRKKALVSVENGKMVIEPVKDFIELRGSIKTNKKALSGAEIHKQFASSVAVEYAKKINK